jgi:hypothetical protein
VSARKKNGGEKGSLVFPFGKKKANPFTARNDISCLGILLRSNIYTFVI